MKKMSYIKNNIEQQANCCCICSTFAWNAEAKQLTVCVYVCEYFAYLTLFGASANSFSAGVRARAKTLPILVQLL